MMHIPSCDTVDIEVLSFDDALVSTNNDYDKSRWIYVPDFYSEYRYILGTRGKKPLICIGINPSTAAPDDLDNTLKSVERIALYNGYDSFIMFNVYAQRATDPDDMEHTLNTLMHEENMRAFAYILGLCEGTPAIWAAWGNIIEKRPYLPACVRSMIELAADYNAQWYSAGRISRKGHPHHPLYLRRDTPLDPFDIDAYIAANIQ